MGFSVIVHDTHIVNTGNPILPYVTDQKSIFLFHGLWLIFYGGSMYPYGCEFSSERHDLQRWGGCNSYVLEERICRSGPWPHNGDNCDALLLGCHFLNQGHGIWRRRCFSRFRIWGCLGDIGHISGRVHIYIPVHPVPYRLLLTAALSDIPLFPLPATISV